MGPDRDYTTRDLVALLVSESGGTVRGVKKLMKLVFLTQYDFPSRVDPDRGAGRVKILTSGGKPLARADFYVWSFGPMSDDVYRVLEGEEFSLDRGTLPFSVRYSGPRPSLPGPVVERVRSILQEYGGMPGWKLEEVVAELTGLRPSVKEEFMGVPFEDYLEALEVKVEEVPVEAEAEAAAGAG